jgi:hypothetical protein
MATSSKLKMNPADILKYQNDLVRTGKYLPGGRIQKIAIGPAAGFTPPAGDPFINKFGRFIELRERFIPFGFSEDRSMLLALAPLVGADGRVGLPDVPDPEWAPGKPSQREIEGDEKVDHAGNKYRMPYSDVARTTPRFIPQRLEDRTNELLQDSNFLVFAPVEVITFQPEIEKRLIGDAWLIKCGVNPADNTHATLLVDRQTGETHFFGGTYEVLGNAQR